MTTQLPQAKQMPTHLHPAIYPKPIHSIPHPCAHHIDPHAPAHPEKPVLTNHVEPAQENSQQGKDPD
ncbi:hypothetical protein IAQ61_001800 [Plenodomus lingam]|uniref:uncharacterized protein n=1 Tax=Leptosphaeria maculans TaxID=5022 RepID=UPI00331E0311|nr:hypothetical protein IAQ61_001800 [Plenodomus lingam]